MTIAGIRHMKCMSRLYVWRMGVRRVSGRVSWSHNRADRRATEWINGGPGGYQFFVLVHPRTPRPRSIRQAHSKDRGRPGSPSSPGPASNQIRQRRRMSPEIGNHPCRIRVSKPTKRISQPSQRSPTRSARGCCVKVFLKASFSPIPWGHAEGWRMLPSIYKAFNSAAREAPFG